MQKTKVLFVLFYLLTSNYKAFGFSFVIEHNKDHVHVTGYFGHDEIQNIDGSIALNIPETIWGTPYYKQIANIQSNGSYNPELKKVFVDPGMDLQIEYDVFCASQDEVIKYFTDRYDHFIDQDKFYLLGLGLFILPPLFNDKVNIQVKTSLQKVAYSNYPYFYQDNILNTSLSELDQLIIVGSNDMTYDSRSNVDMIMLSQDTNLQGSFEQIAIPAFTAQEVFWQEVAENYPQNKLAIIIKAPIKDIIRKYGGTVIGRTILFFIVPENTKEDDLNHLVKHENLHFRFGKLLSGPQWFTEGFTEYYVDKINLYFDKNWFKFVDNYNERVVKYFTSLAHSFDDKNAQDYFFVVPEVEELPYTKGYLIAGQIDSIIDLDGALRSMIHLCKSNKDYCTFSAENLLYFASNVLPEQKKIIENLINDFNQVSLNQSLGRNTKLAFKKHQVYNFSVDVLGIWKTKLVSGAALKTIDANRFDETLNYQVINSDFDFETGQSHLVIQNGDKQENIDLPGVVSTVDLPYYGLSLN